MYHTRSISIGSADDQKINPDISLYLDIILILIKILLKIKVVMLVLVTTNPSFIEKFLLIPWLYPLSYRIVSVSKGVKEELISYFGIKNDKINVIYNSFDYDGIRCKSIEPIPGKFSIIFNLINDALK